MKFAAVITSAEKLGTISEFVLNQLESHFQSWSSEDSDSEYSLQWIKNNLTLKTDSSYLLTKWLNVEKQYLDYLLDENQFLIAGSSEEPELSIAA